MKSVAKNFCSLRVLCGKKICVNPCPSVANFPAQSAKSASKKPPTSLHNQRSKLSNFFPASLYFFRSFLYGFRTFLYSFCMFSNIFEYFPSYARKPAPFPTFTPFPDVLLPPLGTPYGADIPLPVLPTFPILLPTNDHHNLLPIV